MKIFKYIDLVLHELGNKTGFLQRAFSSFLIQLVIVCLLLMEVGIAEIFYKRWLIGTIPCILFLVLVLRWAFVAYKKKKLGKTSKASPPYQKRDFPIKNVINLTAEGALSLFGLSGITIMGTLDYIEGENLSRAKSGQEYWERTGRVQHPPLSTLLNGIFLTPGSIEPMKELIIYRENSEKLPEKLARIQIPEQYITAKWLTRSIHEGHLKNEYLSQWIKENIQKPDFDPANICGYLEEKK